MNRYVRIALAYFLVANIIGIVVFLLVVRTNTNRDATAPQKELSKAKTDNTAIAVDIFRQGSDLAQFRDALNLLSPNLAQPDIAGRVILKPDDRSFLLTAAKLTQEELQELDASHFRVIDAVHVNSAALFRDAARSLEIPGLSELAQAEFAFDWVTRRVLLYEQRQEGLPPAYV